MQLFLMFFLSQPVGLGVDMFGVRPILIPALCCSVGGLIALSFATEYWQIFLAQSICFGFGAAGTFIPALVVAGQYFKRKRALVLGLVASGSSCGELTLVCHYDHRKAVVVADGLLFRRCRFPHHACPALRPYGFPCYDALHGSHDWYHARDRKYSNHLRRPTQGASGAAVANQPRGI